VTCASDMVRGELGAPLAAEGDRQRLVN